MRKQYFIKKGLQTRFITTVFLIIILVAVVLACNLYFFYLFLENQDDNTEGVYKVALERLQKDINDKLFSRLILLVLVNIAIVILISLFFSHQIAGPLYKLEKTLKRIIEGDLGVRFAFRQSDRMDELAELLNDMKDRMVDTIKGIKSLNEKATSQISEIGGGKDQKTLESTLSSLKDIHSQINGLIAEYKLDEPAVAAAEAPAENKTATEDKKEGQA